MQVPEVKIRELGAGRVAFQAWGTGPLRLLLLPEWSATSGVLWEHPAHIRSWRLHGDFGECVRFDRPGIGDSTGPSSFDSSSWAGVAIELVNALGWDEFVVVAEGSACHTALAVCADCPDRASKAMLANGYCGLMRSPTRPNGLSPQQIDAIVRRTAQDWGTGHVVASAAPLLDGGGSFLELCARSGRAACSPEVAAILVREMLTTDISELAPHVRQPALLYHTGDMPLIRIDHTRELVNALPNASLEVFPSSTFYGDPRRREVMEQFLLGGPDRFPDEVKAMLFTDIVDSTRVAATMGDRRWRQVLEDVDAFSALAIQHGGGRVVTRTGDGCLATFNEVRSAVEAGSRLVRAAPELGVMLRAGIHYGTVETRADGDIAGLEVHIAARVTALAGPRQLVISDAVVPHLDHSIALDDLGEHTLKGVPDRRRVFAVI